MISLFLAQCLIAVGTNVQRQLRRSSAAATVQKVSLRSSTGATDGASSTGMTHLVATVLDEGRLQAHELKKASEGMNMEDAMRHLNWRLPTEVASLVHLTSRGKAKNSGDYSEDSLQKARKLLNTMVESAQRDLDEVVLGCETVKTANRQAFEQVERDVAMMGAELSDTERVRVSGNEGIAQQDRQRKEIEDSQMQKEREFKAKWLEMKHEYNLRKNDYSVFSYMIEMTKCKSSFLQLNASVSGTSSRSLRSTRLKTAQHTGFLCNGDGGIEFRFGDPAMQAKMERLLTPPTKLALNKVLQEFQDSEAEELVQLSNKVARTVTTSSTTPLLPTEPPDVLPVYEDVSSRTMAKKCVGDYDCGFLHDTMALEWGKFKDMLDSIKAEMDRQQGEHDRIMSTFNRELSVIGNMKTTSMEKLAEATSKLNALNEEMAEKETQRRELNKDYEEHRRECHKQVSEIVWGKIVGLTCIRNTLMKDSTVTPPDKIEDCEVSDWVPDECLKEDGHLLLCDDSCPQQDPFKCGGTQVVRRKVTQQPNQYGTQCPALSNQRKCNQRKCPVDCVMSMWSGWSKCTKECDGGVQVKTRSVLQKPKHGGRECDTVQEERPCSVGSCDRDCKLSRWSQWGPCSMGCSVEGSYGRQMRSKKVLVPIRGQGRCPRKWSRSRRQVRRCNKHECMGDEVCIAQQDLIIALDASGSLKKDGFETLRDFAATLVGRFKDEYFGIPAMKVGVLLFGNGHLQASPYGESVISPAIPVQPLTNDMDAVKQKIQAQTWQKGFTNMAQAFTLADKMLSQGGRQSAQSAVLVLSDGKYSFEQETASKAAALKDKNVMILMAPITETAGPELKVLKFWASKPSVSNFERIDGLEALKENGDMFAQRLIVKFCPDAVSMSALTAQEDQAAFMRIREDGFPDGKCSSKHQRIGRRRSIEDCADAARELGFSAFSFRKTRRHGICVGQVITFDTNLYNTWQANRRNPSCPSGNWRFSPFYDTYVLKPEA